MEYKGARTENGCRYDLLCFEGIALMLKIFLGRQPLPEYKLAEPANGLQEIIVKEDVGASEIILLVVYTKIYGLDHQDPTICLGCHSAECQVRPGPLRLLHRPPGQTSPELGAPTDPCIHWYP